ncbi:hypothetical protein AB0L22_04155 [Micromonospora haikouensis]
MGANARATPDESLPVLIDPPMRPADVLARAPLCAGGSRDGVPDVGVDPGAVSLGRPLVFPVSADELPGPLRLRAQATE